MYGIAYRLVLLSDLVVLAIFQPIVLHNHIEYYNLLTIYALTCVALPFWYRYSCAACARGKKVLFGCRVLLLPPWLSLVVKMLARATVSKDPFTKFMVSKNYCEIDCKVSKVPKSLLMISQFITMSICTVHSNKSREVLTATLRSTIIA